MTIEDERQHSSGARAASAIATTSTSSANKNKHMTDCFVCKKKIDITVMRKHVGEHIMNNTISGKDACGFCGRRGCENILVKSSKKGTKDFFKIQSNCDYVVVWMKTPQFSTRNPCSNHLIHCSICKATIWTYNVNHHYSDRHPEVETPTLVSEEEVKKMKPNNRK